MFPGRSTVKSLFSRLSILLTTSVLVVAQVIMPAQAAFARGPSNNGTLKVHEIGTASGTESNDPKVCAFNFEGFGFDAGQTGYIMLETQGGSSPVGVGSGPYGAGPASGTGYFVTQDFNTPGATTIPNGTYKATLYGKDSGNNIDLTDDKAKSKVFKVDCAPVPVASAPTATASIVPCVPESGLADKVSVSVTNTDDATDAAVTYTVTLGGQTKSITLADGQTGNVEFDALAPGAYTATVTGTDGTITTNSVTVKLCAVTPPAEISVPTVTVKGICGIGNDTLDYATETDDYISSVSWNDTHTTATISFTIKPGVNKVFTNGQRTASVIVSELNTQNCPRTVQKCETLNPATVVTKKTDFATYDDDRAHGHYGFTQDGLLLSTEDNTSLSKIAWYHAVAPYSLANIGTPAMDYTNNFGVNPGLQVLLDFDGNGTTDGTLVGEAVYGNNWWLTSGSAAFVKAGAPHTGGGNGSEWYGTLDEWLTAFPSAKVTVAGFALGSGVFASGTLHTLTFGCDQWTFMMPVEGGGKGEVPPIPVPTPTPSPTPAPIAQTPAAPATPVVSAGKGAIMPTELPETGASFNVLAIGILASAAAYGAIYFAQPKRYYE